MKPIPAIVMAFAALLASAAPAAADPDPNTTFTTTVTGTIPETCNFPNLTSATGASNVSLTLATPQEVFSQKIQCNKAGGLTLSVQALYGVLKNTTVADTTVGGSLAYSLSLVATSSASGDTSPIPFLTDATFTANQQRQASTPASKGLANGNYVVKATLKVGKDTAGDGPRIGGTYTEQLTFTIG